MNFVNAMESVVAVANAANPNYISELDLFHQFRNNCGIFAPFVENILSTSGNVAAVATYQEMTTRCRNILQRPRNVVVEMLRLPVVNISTNSVPSNPTTLATTIDDSSNNNRGENDYARNMNRRRRNGSSNRLRRRRGDNNQRRRRNYGDNPAFNIRNNNYQNPRRQVRFNNNLPNFRGGGGSNRFNNFAPFRQTNYPPRPKIRSPPPFGAGGQAFSTTIPNVSHRYNDYRNHQQSVVDLNDIYDGGNMNSNYTAVVYSNLRSSCFDSNNNNNIDFHYSCQVSSDEDNDYLLVDSGSTHTHVTNTNFLTNIDRNPDLSVTIKTASGEECTSEGTANLGNIKVFYTPKFTTQLLSIEDIVQFGYVIHFSENEVKFVNPFTNSTDAVGIKFGRSYLIRKETVSKLCSIKHYGPLQQQSKDNQLNYIQILSSNFNFDPKEIVSSTAAPTSTKLQSNFITWHSRTHLNLNHLKTLVQNRLVKGMNLRLSDFDTRLSVCPHCAIGKIRRRSYKKARTKIQPSEKLTIFYSDLKGPISPVTISREQYVASFICAKTKFKWIYFLKTKDAVADAFEMFHANIVQPLRHNRTRTTEKLIMHSIISDGGGEYLGRFQQSCQNLGYAHFTTPAYTPELNGLAENYWRTLFGLVRCMLNQAQHMPRNLWHYAVAYSNFILNRTLIVTHNSVNKTAYEWLYEEVPDVSKLKIFGSEVFTYIPKQQRLNTSIGPHSQKGYFVGFSDYQLKTAMILLIDENTSIPTVSVVKSDEDNIIYNEIVEARHLVDTGEEVIPILDFQNSTTKTPRFKRTTTKYPLVDEPALQQFIHSIMTKRKAENLVRSESDVESTNQDKRPSIVSNNQDQLTGIRQSARIKERNQRIALPTIVMTSDESSNFQNVGPTTAAAKVSADISLREAMKSEDWPMFFKAALAELQSIGLNGVWEEVYIPFDDYGEGPIPLMWLFKRKYDENGAFIKFKARLVVLGNRTIKGIDYIDTFAPVAKVTSLRIFFSLCVQLRLYVFQTDVETAFQNAELEETIYVQFPQLYSPRNSRNNCLKLRRALYGLPQAPRQWYLLVDSTLKSIGYSSISAEPCIYQNGEALILLYVDDMLFGYSSEAHFQVIIQALESKFTIKRIGVPKSVLGIRVNFLVGGSPARSVITLDNTAKIIKLAEDFHLLNVKGNSISTVPINPYINLSDIDQLKKTSSNGLECNIDEHVQYRSLIGAMMYIMTSTRPDISYGISFLSQFLSKPLKAHLYAAKQVLKFLYLTKEQGLIYQYSSSISINAFSDADWGNNFTNRRSRTGTIIYLGKNVVYWSSNIQATVSLSTTQSEIYALKETVKSVIWIRRIVSQTNLLQPLPLPPSVVFVDNKSAIRIAKNPEVSKRNRHFDFSYHFIRENIHDFKHIQLDYVQSEHNEADILTKALKPERFHLLSRKLVGNVENIEEYLLYNV
jgi:hypothetical protein